MQDTEFLSSSEDLIHMNRIFAGMPASHKKIEIEETEISLEKDKIKEAWNTILYLICQN